ncbi:MAG TPA: energy transducer TonB [Cyclobacteriaceae bacterium]
MLRIVTLVFSIFYSGLLLAQTQGLEDRPDVIASFPGGDDSLYAYIVNRVIYPKDAVVKKVEGTVFVEFIVEKSGNINPQSIKILRSLLPSIDNEGIRLVKLFPKWNPALKNNVPIDSRYVLPIDFTLDKETTVPKTEEAPPYLYFNIRKPFSATIKRKSVTATSPNWNIYLQSDQIDVVGKVEPGATVIVVDWDHNVYGISPSPGLSSSFQSGFISSSALSPNASLDSIAGIVIRYRNPKHLRNTPRPVAHMSLTSNENTVYVGECVLVDWALNVNVLNKAPISFTNLDKQVPSLLDGPFDLKSCWRRNRFITTIVPMPIHIGNEHYMSYSVNKEVYCPTEVRNLQFPSIPLKILKRKYINGSEMDTIQFSSKPLVITVKALPSTLTNTNSSFLPVGKFTLEDSVSVNCCGGRRTFFIFYYRSRRRKHFPY